MIDRNLLPPLPPMRAAAVALLLTAVLLAAAPAAHAREGLYIGIGPAGHSVSDDIDGTQRFTAPDGLSEVRAGKPDSGSGFAVGGGYGINPYLSLDLLITRSSHDAEFDPGAGSTTTFDADLTSVLAGVKVIAPVAEVLELFLRAGIGGYELEYSGAQIRLADGAVLDDARFSGSGAALGVGLELALGAWGLELAVTQHSAEFDSLQTTNFPDATLQTPLEADVLATNLMVTFHFP